MPTYDYRCKECGHELEAQQAFTDDPLTECPACGAQSLRKKFGSVGISFKGSGFYKTDSRSGSSSSSSSSTSSSSTTTSSSSTSDASTSSASSSTGSSDSSSTTKTAAPSTSSSSGSSD